MSLPAKARLVAYLRDSGGKDQDLSLEQQEAAIRAWCTHRGHELTHIFRDEGISGGSTVGRRGFHEMMHHFAQGNCTDHGVVVWKYNRFARDFDDAQFFKADLRRRGYVIHSMNDQVPDGPDGRLFEAAIDWMSQRYRADMARDIKRGLFHLVRAHGAIPSKPPVGFKWLALDLGKRRDGSAHIVHRWAPDPELLERVQLAFKLKAEGYSHRYIEAHCKLFSNTTSYTKFFSNPIYIGELHFGKGDDEIVIPEYCPPMIDRDTWDRVQILSQKNRLRRHKLSANAEGGNADHPRRLAASGYLLSGLVRCSSCGSLMYGETNINTYGQRYYYYACGTGKNKYHLHCKNKRIPRAELEAEVMKILTGYLKKPALVGRITKLGNDHLAVHHSARKKLLEYEMEHTTIETKMEKIVATIEDMGGSKRLAERLRNLEVRQRELELLSQDLRTIPEPAQLEAGEISGHLSDVAALLSADVAKAKPILRGLIKQVTVLREGRGITGSVELYLPTEILSMMRLPSKRAMPTIWIAASSSWAAFVPP
jgi:site-specific DNA recombinase